MSHNDEVDTSTEFYFDYVRLLVENRMLHRAGYYLGASNQFVRLFKLIGRKYWLAQASSEHLTADWKVHFSIRSRDIPRAFNLLAQLYFDMKLPVGLKARYPDDWKDYENRWPDHMRGREITVYILLIESTLENVRTTLYSSHELHVPLRMIDWTLASTSDVFLTYDLTSKDEIPLDRYLEFVDRAEQLLENNRIESNGCADGDYPIGKYTSLRNEKFVAIEETNAKETTSIRLIYPPNECGYNGACDVRDLAKEIIDLASYRKKMRTRQTWTMIKIVIKIMIFFLLVTISLKKIYD